MNDINKEIEVEFSYTRKDFRKMTNDYFNKMFNFWIVHIIFGIVSAVTMINWYRSGFILSDGILPLLFLGAFCFFILWQYVIPMNKFDKIINKPHINSFYLIMSREQILIKSKDLESKCNWGIFKKAVVFKDSYLFFYRDRKGTFFIPRRAFKTSSDDEKVFSILIELSDSRVLKLMSYDKDKLMSDEISN